MPTSPITYAKTCDRCGKPLRRIEVELFGKARSVPCYGSCGCEGSAEVLERYGVHKPSTPSSHLCPMCGGEMLVEGMTGYVSECIWCGYTCVHSSDLEAVMSGRRLERRMFDGVLRGTGVPELYWSVAPDRERAARIEDTGKGLLIVGGNGTAKTLLAASIAKAYAEEGMTVRFASSVKMLSEFKDSYGGSKPEGEIFEELNGCDLLVIDDLGKENPTSWAGMMLYAVIDGRYGSKRPIVVTTNYAEDELARRIAKASDESTARALMSRLFEMTEKVVLGGPDRRLL